MRNIVVPLIFLAICGRFCLGAKILGIFPTGPKSHYMVFDPLMVELARRGHRVTVATAFPKPAEMIIPNYKEIDTSTCLAENHPEITTEYAYAHRRVEAIMRYMKINQHKFDTLFECPPMKQLANSKESFDVVFTEIFFSDATAVFAHLFQAPLISFVANTLYPWAADRVGNPLNPSHVMFNHNCEFLGMRPSFWQRLDNAYAHALARIAYKYLGMSEANHIVEKHFPGVPSLQELTSNTSLIFTFSHFSFNMPAPLVPNVVEVSGLHIKPAAALPKNLKKFMDEAKDGIVYFSMGSIVKSESLPPEIKSAFVHAFSQIPQRVIWRFGQEKTPKREKNIITAKWFPQRDILAHPNMKLFISHGGALGTTEAVFEGVPVLGIPFYGDQTINVKTLQYRGAGEVIDYSEITNGTLLAKVKLILDNYDEYKKNAAKLSEIYKDRPMNPLDTAVYWTEYVIRHKGAYHLRSPAADMPWYQYFLVDVFSFVLLASAAVISSLIYVLNRIVKKFKIFRKEKKC